MSNWWSCPRSGHRLLWGTNAEGQSTTSCPSSRCGYSVVVPGLVPAEDKDDTPPAAPKRRRQTAH